MVLSAATHPHHHLKKNIRRPTTWDEGSAILLPWATVIKPVTKLPWVGTHHFLRQESSVSTFAWQRNRAIFSYFTQNSASKIWLGASVHRGWAFRITPLGKMEPGWKSGNIAPKPLVPQWIFHLFIRMLLITGFPKKPRAAVPHLSAYTPSDKTILALINSHFTFLTSLLRLWILSKTRQEP